MDGIRFFHETSRLFIQNIGEIVTLKRSNPGIEITPNTKLKSICFIKMLAGSVTLKRSNPGIEIAPNTELKSDVS